MIPKKYYGAVFSMVMSLMMGLLMAGIITGINTGLDAAFFGRWMKSFSIAVPTSFVCMQFLRPLAETITGALTKGDLDKCGHCNNKIIEGN